MNRKKLLLIGAGFVLLICAIIYFIFGKNFHKKDEISFTNSKLFSGTYKVDFMKNSLSLNTQNTDLQKNFFATGFDSRVVGFSSNDIVFKSVRGIKKDYDYSNVDRNSTFYRDYLSGVDLTKTITDKELRPGYYIDHLGAYSFSGYFWGADIGLHLNTILASQNLQEFKNITDIYLINGFFLSCNPEKCTVSGGWENPFNFDYFNDFKKYGPSVFMGYGLNPYLNLFSNNDSSSFDFQNISSVKNIDNLDVTGNCKIMKQKNSGENFVEYLYCFDNNNIPFYIRYNVSGGTDFPGMIFSKEWTIKGYKLLRKIPKYTLSQLIDTNNLDTYETKLINNYNSYLKSYNTYSGSIYNCTRNQGYMDYQKCISLNVINTMIERNDVNVCSLAISTRGQFYCLFEYLKNNPKSQVENLCNLFNISATYSKCVNDLSSYKKIILKLANDHTYGFNDLQKNLILRYIYEGVESCDQMETPKKQEGCKLFYQQSFTGKNK